MMSLTTNNNVPTCISIYCCASVGAHISTSEMSLSIKTFASYNEIRLKKRIMIK